MNPRTETIQGGRHHIQRSVASETAARAQPLPLLDRGVIQKIASIYSTIASTGILLLFPSFLSLTRMPITTSRLISQGDGCLHMAPPSPHHRPPRPPGVAIGTLYSHDGRGYRLAQAIQIVKCGGLDLMETSPTDSCSNNRRVYRGRGAVVRPSRASGSYYGVGLVL